MNKRVFLFIAMALFFAAAGLGRNAFSAGATVVKIDESFPFTDNVLTNPCDPSGNSDVTAHGTITEKGTIVEFPDGSENVSIRESVTGTGIDPNGNEYTIGGFEGEHESRTGFGEVAVLKFTSSTGPGFLLIVNLKELKNNTVEHQKAICFAN